MNIDQILANSNHTQAIVSEAVRRLKASEVAFKRVRLSIPVRYMDWSIQRLSIGSQHATMAFTGNTIRCLALSLGKGVSYSILDTRIEGIENLFKSWINVNVDQLP